MELINEDKMSCVSIQEVKDQFSSWLDDVEEDISDNEKTRILTGEKDNKLYLKFECVEVEPSEPFGEGDLWLIVGKENELPS